ncbi:MAG: metal ABC transporter permease [Caldicoprobacterales bacterium]|nr:metal ABC transporter permease [Clostridiales bacterium]
MFDSLLQYQFLQNAVISAILASIACGIIGSIIIEKRLVMMSGGIAHTAFGGIGLGYFLGIEPIIGALFITIFAAMGIATIKRKTTMNTDIPIGIFWAAGMSLGILFIALTPGYPPDMTTYLFGDILTVSRNNLYIITLLDAVVIFAVAALYHQLKAYLFDEEFSTVIGIKTTLIEYLLFILIALTVVVVIHVIGIILIMALLTAPPAIAKLFTNNLKKLMLTSSLLGIFFTLTGLWISYTLNIPSGAAIALFISLVYGMVSIIKVIMERKVKSQQLRTQDNDLIDKPLP